MLVQVFRAATLTTVSYGDITPLNPVARSLAALESVIGQLFPVLLLARLVSMELHDRKERMGARHDRDDDQRHSLHDGCRRDADRARAG